MTLLSRFLLWVLAMAPATWLAVWRADDVRQAEVDSARSESNARPPCH